MKLSISNIAWSENDEAVYAILKQSGFQGLEIAPTRLFPISPYEALDSASAFSQQLFDTYGLTIPSMQSIWYGRGERIFQNQQSQQLLIDYTKSAIDFAAAIQCKSLVFGNPKQRNRMPGDLDNVAFFFENIANAAQKKDVIIALEANPSIYGTNMFNSTQDVIAFVREINHPALKINLDVGTMIVNNEQVNILTDHVDIIQHVHISEPYLAPIEARPLHDALIRLLMNGGYDGFLSIEMKTPPVFDDVLKSIDYLIQLNARLTS
ncbi:sugar phosphate isomerase/epimerase [Fusibacter paucivorans]|uniref:Sugar phosphate isomerase/epimerase n=1 Tax=Fusibacter paucivorans TaxID=76009 RepID=A0ABS5PRV9_9FIRM|nr:sugar phosphate isomerase/epimerase family protein [Fusibacter paucivorans]MBS7526802.1 sugar phosphate isomerase/epimerase [Fusibacter paucivorans]